MFWPHAVTHSAWTSRMHAQGRKVNCPEFGAKISARMREQTRRGASWLDDRARDAYFLGIDPDSQYLIGYIDDKATKPELRWVIEPSSSFVVHPKPIHQAGDEGAPQPVEGT